MRSAALLFVAVCCLPTPSSAFSFAAAPMALAPHVASQRLGTRVWVESRCRSNGKLPQLRGAASNSENEGAPVEPSTGAPSVETPSSSQSRIEKGKAQLLLIQNGSFGLGTALVLLASGVHITSAEDPSFVGPVIKAGLYIFFLGVILQYSETYDRCSYIRFFRQGLMNPASVARRGRRVLRLVDGNIFKFLLPGIFGRSYDIIDGKPVQKEGWTWRNDDK